MLNGLIKNAKVYSFFATHHTRSIQSIHAEKGACPLKLHLSTSSFSTPSPPPPKKKSTGINLELHSSYQIWKKHLLCFSQVSPYVTVLDSGLHAMDSGFQVLDSGFQ